MNQVALAEVGSERQEELLLLDRVIQGRHDARTRFFLRYSQVVELGVRQTLRRCGRWITDDDFQDIVNDVWLSMFEHDMRPLRRFDPGRGVKVKTWIGLLARNRTVDRLRRSQIRRTVSIDDDEGATREPASSRPLPTDELERREQGELVAKAMEQLSAEERRFISAWYVDNREPEELASEFGIALGTVYSRRFKIQGKLARAIRRLDRPRRPITPRTLH